MSSFSYVIGLVSEAPIMAGLVFLAILLSVAASLTYRALLASKLSGWFSFSNVPDWARLASKVEFVTAQNSQEPSLHLVGAGTGDPGLLTLAALHAIQQADLVIADILVSSDILKLVDTRKTEIKIANKVKGRATIAQREIESWIVDGLEKQLRVVRLKGGDPYVYGRGAEEIMAARAAGFGSCISMIPGISSTLAAPAAAGIALTSRGVANQFVVTTGVGAEGAKTTIPPYKPTRTTVLLMSVRRIQSISERMIKEGYPARTPVCIVERASTPSQRSTNTNLHALSEGYASVRGIASPATIVVGTVADETYRLPGYKRLPTTIQSNNTQLSAYEDDLKEKEKMIEGMEVKLRMANEEKSRIERALISANHHHQTEIQELNVIITGLLDSIQTLEREAAEEEVRKERIWSEKTAEIESLKQKVMDLRIDHSVVEHRMELARQQLEKEYEEKKTEVSVEADTRIVNTIERVARAQFERLHDMTVLKNKFVRDHENEMEALKASVEIKEREIVENSKKAEEKIEAIARELAEAKDSYARELNVVSDLSSSRAIEIEKLKTEISDANEKEREIVEELKTVQSALFEEKAKVARVEQGSSETLKQAEWDFFSENAKLKQVEHELELKLEHANLEKHQIERALYSSAAHENELQEKVKSMKNSIAKAAKEVEYTEAKLEQSNLEKFQIQRALITRTKNEEELREEVVNMKNSVEQWAKAVQLSEEKLEQSNLEKFQIERALITRTKNEEELSKNVQDLTARQVSFETQFRAARRAAKAERNALYALARNENAKAHKRNFVTDTKDIESERYAQYAQMRDDLEGMQRKVKLAQTACEAERRAREVAETERDSALLELSASNARLVEEQQNVGKEEASSSSSTSGESRESRMEALVRENEELIERVKLLEIVALDAREQEALAVNRLEAIELKARERRNRVSSAIDSHGEIEKENRDSNSGARSSH